MPAFIVQSNIRHNFKRAGVGATKSLGLNYIGEINKIIARSRVSSANTACTILAGLYACTAWELDLLLLTIFGHRRLALFHMYRTQHNKHTKWCAFFIKSSVIDDYDWIQWSVYVTVWV